MVGSRISSREGPLRTVSKSRAVLELLCNLPDTRGGGNEYDESDLGGVAEGLTPAELEQRIAAIGEQLDARGFAERSADVLRHAGYKAWRNCVGHIAIAPF